MGFTFKQFHIEHNKCAMKVGTDGILLGAWAPVESVSNILDIGTGSGLIALMLAQRSPVCQIQAIDLDKGAIAQARDNIAMSPWSDRIQVQQSRLQDYQPAIQFDLIVSNPPYFPPGQPFDCVARQHARHTGSLGISELIAGIDRLLNQGGSAALVLPVTQRGPLDRVLQGFDLEIRVCCEVFSKSSKPAIRHLLLLSRGTNCDVRRDKLFIYGESGTYSPEYVALTRSFYLKM